VVISSSDSSRLSGSPRRPLFLSTLITGERIRANYDLYPFLLDLIVIFLDGISYDVNRSLSSGLIHIARFFALFLTLIVLDSLLDMDALASREMPDGVL